MPGLNRRGPINDGPMTGRRMGRCNPENKAKTDEEILQSRNVENPGQDQIFDRGLGRGRGRGFGRGLGRGTSAEKSERSTKAVSSKVFFRDNFYSPS